MVADRSSVSSHHATMCRDEDIQLSARNATTLFQVKVVSWEVELVSPDLCYLAASESGLVTPKPLMALSSFAITRSSFMSPTISFAACSSVCSASE